MKKLLIITGLIFIVVALNAQLFMGARFDIKAEQVNSKDGDTRTTDFSFGFYDDLGYQMNELWDIGVEFGGMVGAYKNHYSNTEKSSANWLLSPYVRYSVFKHGKFDLKAKGLLCVEGTQDDDQVSIQMVPVLVYNLSDRIALQSNLNFFNCGIYYTNVKDGNKTTRFSLGGNSKNVSTLGSLTIGFLYKF